MNKASLLLGLHEQGERLGLADDAEDDVGELRRRSEQQAAVDGHSALADSLACRVRFVPDQ